MAIVRALEAARPENIRICHDPIARSMVSPVKLFFSRLLIDSGLYGLLFPGAIEFITARERYIDDFLIACLVEGLDQVVILGAGFDTRAFRIEGIEKTHVFEIDHPATQEAKLKRLKKAVNPIPGHVTFVSIDFNKQTLEESLLASSYNECGKTLFIWQGVIMYLTSEGADSTLSFIAHHSGAGSAVVFDYFYNETLRDMKMKSTNWILRQIGERMLFGIPEGHLEDFLTQRGFRDIHNAEGDELKKLYFAGSNSIRPISKGVAIASARVSDQDMGT